MSSSGNVAATGRLRRSSRAPKKTSTEYNIGDLVEVQRGGVIVQARLIQLLTEGSSSPNPRWLIRTNSSNKDEEVYEHIFIGKILDDPIDKTEHRRSTSSPVSSSSVTSSQQQIETTTIEHSRSNGGGGATKKKKTHHHGTDTSTVVGGETTTAATHSDSSTRNNSGPKGNMLSKRSKSSKTSSSNSTLAMSREARSRRRQAIFNGNEPIEGNVPKQTVQSKIEETMDTGSSMVQTESIQGGIQRKRTLTGAAKLSVDSKRDRESKVKSSGTTTTAGKNSTTTTTNNKMISNIHHHNTKVEEECVKIKFLTGTLYLYRGRNRRAEFIRRV